MSGEADTGLGSNTSFNDRSLLLNVLLFRQLLMPLYFAFTTSASTFAAHIWFDGSFSSLSFPLLQPGLHLVRLLAKPLWILSPFQGQDRDQLPGSSMRTIDPDLANTTLRQRCRIDVYALGSSSTLHTYA